MHVLSHQLERVWTASCVDCSTEHSRFAAILLPRQIWWKLALRPVHTSTILTVIPQIQVLSIHLNHEACSTDFACGARIQPHLNPQ